MRELAFKAQTRPLVDFAVDPDVVRALREEEGLGDEQILLRVLGLPEGELELRNVRDIIFPEIRENPFTASDSVGTPFELAFRVIDSRGRSIFARATLYMYRNPFTDRQFAFFPPGIR